MQTAHDKQELARQRAKAWYYANKERARATRKQWYEANKEKMAEYNAEYRLVNGDTLREYDRQRSKLPHRREQARQTSKSRLSKSPMQIRARGAVGNAIRKGLLPRANTLRCVTCNAAATGYHHHRGYAIEHRLDVIPLCTACHFKADK